MRTFIIRLQEDTARSGASAPRLCGVVDEVATGLRARFRSDSELVAALMAAAGGGPPGPLWGHDDRAGYPASHTNQEN